jgi:hypothetical protein
MRDGGRSAIIGVLLLVLLLAPPPAAAGPPASVQYELILDCPQSLNIQRPPPGGPGVRPNSIGLRCPITAIDEDDMMGSPSMAVDSRNPNNLIIASLHGIDATGPSDRSRGRQPFTTFLSADHGATWNDKPYYPPDELRQDGALGEHAQVYIDSLGHVYVGSMYVRRTENTQEVGGWNYTIVAQKFKDYFDAVRFQTMNGDHNAKFVETYYPNQRVEQFWFAHDDAKNVMSILWNERVPPPSTTGGLLPPVGEDTRKSVIGLSWSNHEVRQNWRRVANESNLVGPCSTTTNPVVSRGQIYIGCMVDTNETSKHPYAWAPKGQQPKVGQIDIFRWNTGDEKPQWMGTAPVRGGQPMLGVRNDGRVVLMTAFVGPDGAFKLIAAYGQADPNKPKMSWTTTKQYGDDILKPSVGRRILSTTMQDLMYREESGVVHVIIKQQFEPLGITVDDVASLTKSQYNKVVVAIHEQYGVLVKIDLDIGNRLNRTIFSGVNPLERNQEAVFNDLTDDIIQLPPANWTYREKPLTDYRREFFAVGDYGVIKFGELIELTNLRAPGAPPPEPPPPPEPSAALSANITTVIMGSVATALLGLLALKLVLNRRSDPIAAMARQGK